MLKNSWNQGSFKKYLCMHKNIRILRIRILNSIKLFPIRIRKVSYTYDSISAFFWSVIPSTPLEELSSIFCNSKRFVLYFISGSNYKFCFSQIKSQKEAQNPDPEQDPDPDPYLWLMDPDPEVPKTSGGSRSATLVFSYGSGSTPPTSGSGSRRFKRYESDGSGSKGLFTYSDPGEQIQYGSYRVRIQNNKKRL